MSTLDRATIVSFDAATYTATIRYDQSLSTYQTGVPVARHLPLWQLRAGDQVAVAVFDEAVPADRCVIAVYNLTRTKPMCRVYHSANQSLTSGVAAVLAFGAERYDTDTLHDTAVNNSRITMVTPGKYRFGASVEYEANATGVRLVHVLLNGTTAIATETEAAAGAAASRLTISGEYAFAAGDYLQLQVYQDSGGALSVVSAGNYSPEFWVEWVEV